MRVGQSTRGKRACSRVWSWQVSRCRHSRSPAWSDAANSRSQSGQQNRVRSGCSTHTSTRAPGTDSSTRPTPHGATRPSRWRYNSVSRTPQILPPTAHHAQTGPTENPEAPNNENASMCIGRVGGPAVALGVGAAILTTCGMACADDGSSNSTHASATSSTSGSTDRPASVRNSKRPSARAKTPPAADASAAPDLSAADTESSSTTSSTAGGGKLRGEHSKPLAAALARLTTAPDTTAPPTAAPEATPQQSVAPEATAVPKASSALAALLPKASAVTTLPKASSVPTALLTPSPLATARSLRAVPTANIGIPTVPSGVVSLVLTTIAELGLAVAVSVINPIVPSPTVVSPTLTLNGYQIVPNSTEKVTSFYGQWAYLPGSPSVVQGQQQFDLVDPRTEYEGWHLRRSGDPR